MRPSAVKTIQFRATSDVATQERVKQIRQAYLARTAKAGKVPIGGERGRPKLFNALMAEIVLWTFSSAARRNELERFYTDEWLYKLEPARIELALQLKWDAVANDALVVMAAENIGTGNKSETLRVIIAFAASRRFGIPLTR